MNRATAIRTIAAFAAIGLSAACAQFSQEFSRLFATRAANQRAKIRLRWVGEPSPKLLGYNIYRSASADGKDGWMRVNPKVVPAASAKAGEQAPYEYIDTFNGLVRGRDYYYWIEGVNTDGTTFGAWWPPTKIKAQIGLNEPFPK